MASADCPLRKRCEPTAVCPVDVLRARLIAEVSVSAAQAARLAGVTQRQLLYWAAKGLIPTAGPADRRTFDLATIVRVALIAAHLAAGKTLQQAGLAAARCADCAGDPPPDDRPRPPDPPPARRRGLSVAPLQLLVYRSPSAADDR